MNQEWMSRALVCGVKGWGGGSCRALGRLSATALFRVASAADASLRMATSFVSDATLGNQSPARPKAQGLQVHKNCSPPPNLPMTT